MQFECVCSQPAVNVRNVNNALDQLTLELIGLVRSRSKLLKDLLILYFVMNLI